MAKWRAAYTADPADKTAASASTHQGYRVQKSTMRTMAAFNMEYESTGYLGPPAVFGMIG
jgi:hypothetical protein